MYSKIEASEEIVFYFKHADLFDDVQHQSAFMCKNIVSKEGEDLLERYAITDDERPMYDICIRETMPDVYDVMKPIMYGIVNAVTDVMNQADLDTLIGTPSPTPSSDTYVVVCVQDNGAYNPNDLKNVDTAIRTMIEQGVLSFFYTRVIHPDLTKMAASMYAANGETLAIRIMPLRRKTRF